METSELAKWVEKKRTELADREAAESRAFRQSTHFGSHAQAFSAISAKMSLLDELEKDMGL